MQNVIKQEVVKFLFSKKAKKINGIFTVDLTVTIYCQIDGEVLSIFVAFSENVNFNKIAMDFLKLLFKLRINVHFQKFIKMSKC